MMVQPKKPPVSIRLPDETRAAVEQYAMSRGIPRNAAYVELIQRGLKVATGAGSPVSKPPRAPVAPKVSVNVPLAGTFERKPYQKGQKK